MGRYCIMFTLGRHNRLLTPSQTCWHVARADRFAHIIDGADYFTHVKAAMLCGRHRIMHRMGFRRQDDIRERRQDTPRAPPTWRLFVLDGVEAAGSRGLPTEVQSAPAPGFRSHLVRAHPGGAGEIRSAVSACNLRSTGHVQSAPSITRKSRSSTTQWRSAVESTSPSTDGTPLRITMRATAVGPWGAVTGHATIPTGYAGFRSARTQPLAAGLRASRGVKCCSRTIFGFPKDSAA